MKKLLVMLLCAMMLLATGCSGEKEETASGPVHYTFHTYANALYTDYNPFAYEFSFEDEILQLITTPLVDYQISDTETGSTQCVYKAAVSITDVTADHQDDLDKYGATLPEGVTSSADITEGYVYEIKIRDDLYWSDGTPITADTYIYSMEARIDPKMQNYRSSGVTSGDYAIAGANTYYTSDGSLDFEATVGYYKVDDYTFRRVCNIQTNMDTFLYGACQSYDLVYEPYWEAAKDTSGDLVSTSYNTTTEYFMSYGPYYISGLQTDKQLTFEKNQYWYGYTYDEEQERYVGTSTYEVDGKTVEVYQADTIVYDVMTADAAKEAFLKGELSFWQPSSDDLTTYRLSENLYARPQTFTMSYFMNCKLENLQKMDESYGTTNAVVFSSDKFRKAMSLSIDRTSFASALSGYTPAAYLMNDTWFYILDDPASSYFRETEEGMKAIVELYDIPYGDQEGAVYATLEEAYESCTGYNLAAAKELMKEACEELVAAGLYTAGEDIYIRVAYAAGAITSEAQGEMAMLTDFVNAALEGSGFGTITFEAVGNLAHRYNDVKNGEYVFGRGAWGGGTGYNPFAGIRVYLDNDYVTGGVNEAGSWDPNETYATIEVEGTEYTMTFQQWSKAILGGGQFYNCDIHTRLAILAELEKQTLEKYYTIPFAEVVYYDMLSYQVEYITHTYNAMYAFGGVELMHFNYSDDAWTTYVSDQGGTLSYE